MENNHYFLTMPVMMSAIFYKYKKSHIPVVILAFRKIMIQMVMLVTVMDPSIKCSNFLLLTNNS